MSAMYTPGPWRLGTPGPNGCYTVGNEHGLMTAMVAHSINHKEQAEQAVADAHLIAAAPELFEALEQMIAACSAHPFPNLPVQRPLIAARAAIAKARGES